MKLETLARSIERVDSRVLLLAFNALALAVFFFVAFRYNHLHPDNIGRLMFSTPDTWQYRDIANWLFGKLQPVPPSTAIRPLLYPLFLGSIGWVAQDPYVFWAVQFLLWVATINLTALAVFRFTNRAWLAIIAFCVMMLNVSTIVYTFYALTETLVLFWWSLWLFIFSGADVRNLKPREAFWLLAILSLLTVTKPIYQLHLFAFLAYVLITGIRHRQTILFASLAVLPVLFQIIFNANLNGIVGVSNISEYTLKWYLLPQVFALRAEIALPDARNAVKDYDALRSAVYLLQEPVSTAHAYLQNLIENLTGACEVLAFYPKPYLFTRLTSIAYLIAQIIFLPVIGRVFSRKEPLARAIQWLYFFSCLVIFTSGISFNEGDRLVLGAVPLWVAIYSSLPALFSKSNA